MTISGTTRVVGIFGDPVAHSFSPKMHNVALEAAGIDAVYVPFHVTPGQLPEAVAAIRSLDLSGINLTVPHKEAACELVDDLDPVATLCGAINTIVRRGERLVGCNTDGQGLLRAIHEDLGIGVQGKRVLILGAGGAARAALVALATAGAAWIGVANRTSERAQQLLVKLSPHFTGTAFAAYSLGGDFPAQLAGAVDLLVNSTTVGLHGAVFPWSPAICVRPAGAVYDMVYGREPTPLVLAARSAGLVAADGLGMLAGQGEEAFRLWFATPPPPGLMRATLEGLRHCK
jgi:shikimate dehydrogenase